MKLSAPKQVTWVIAVILGVVGLLIQADVVAEFISAFWLVAAAFILLAVAAFVKGL